MVRGSQWAHLSWKIYFMKWLAPFLFFILFFFFFMWALCNILLLFPSIDESVAIQPSSSSSRIQSREVYSFAHKEMMTIVVAFCRLLFVAE